MPKANPFVQISKSLASIQAKSAKINEEIKTLAAMVDAEMKKQAAAPAPVKATPVKAPAKAAPKAVAAKAPPAVTPKAVKGKVAEAVSALKKKGRPFKK
jgi:hypothetical protein